MLKRFKAIATAALLLAAGLTAVTAPASHATGAISQLAINVTGAPLSGMPASVISINNLSMTPQWNASAATWSPSLSGGSFSANTTYAARVTLTTASNNDPLFTNLSSNAFTLSGAGSTGTTESNTVVSTSSSSVVVDITFPNTGSGNQQNQGGGNQGGSSPVTHTSISFNAPAAGGTPRTNIVVMDMNNPLQWMSMGQATWTPSATTFQS